MVEEPARSGGEGRRVAKAARAAKRVRAAKGARAAGLRLQRRGVAEEGGDGWEVT